MAAPALQAFRIHLSCSNGYITARPHLLRYGKHSSSVCRLYSIASSPSTSAVVVGAGPGGITVVGNLLEHGAALHTDQQKLFWVDPRFQGGRVNSHYREVPSNTKAGLFVQFAHDVSPFKAIVKTTRRPNAFTALEELPQEQGCRLSYAADMCVTLTDGLMSHPEVQPHQGIVTSAVLNKQTNVWTVSFDDGGHVTTSKIALCTGSSPISKTLHAIESIHQESLEPVDLDVALAPSRLAKAFNPNTHATVAVVGASHSAILVLMNLVNLTNTTHPHLRIKWFTRNELRYAEFMDGWILRDNTGLKGQAAEWAHENLDEKAFPKSPVSNVITKVWTAGNKDAYKAELPGCKHIIQAVGYVQNPLPSLEIIREEGGVAEPLRVKYDNSNGRFYEKGDSEAEGDHKYVPGLFGAGIAFPERVTDPHGNVEYAVGFWKFMKFVKKVVPTWVKS
ncbi:hypothetical protein F5B18DRAFT_349324 [Nemania serpens]|nr:hypothetical protein F5B18DRAFT_349324 [Nemania serpens]